MPARIPTAFENFTFSASAKQQQESAGDFQNRHSAYLPSIETFGATLLV